MQHTTKVKKTYLAKRNNRKESKDKRVHLSAQGGGERLPPAALAQD